MLGASAMTIQVNNHRSREVAIEVRRSQPNQHRTYTGSDNECLSSSNYTGRQTRGQAMFRSVRSRGGPDDQVELSQHTMEPRGITGQPAQEEQEHEQSLVAQSRDQPAPQLRSSGQPTRQAPACQGKPQAREARDPIERQSLKAHSNSGQPSAGNDMRSSAERPGPDVQGSKQSEKRIV